MPRVGYLRVTHPFAAPYPGQAPGRSLDLHVLSAPPAFVLSQDQTLREELVSAEAEDFTSSLRSKSASRGGETGLA
jgi:hypothetical protein